VIKGALETVRSWLAPGGRAALLGRVVDFADEAIITADLDGRVTSWNAAAERLYGWSSEEAVGQSVDLIFPEDRLEERRAITARARRGEATARYDTIRRRKDGSPVHVSVGVYPITGRGGKVVATASFVTDITERKRLERLLRLYDPVTALPNRQGLKERIAMTIASSERVPQEPFAVVLLDLDRFGDARAALGDANADAILRAVAQRIVETSASTHAVARLEEDHFAVVITSVVTAGDAAAMAARFRSAIAAPIWVGGRELRLGACAGVAMYPDDGTDADTLLRGCFRAVEDAKRSERAAPAGAAGIDRFELLSELREALAKQRLELHYQPIVDARTRRTFAVEALLRWQHPVRGAIAPGAYLPLAEETGLIADVDRYVLRAAARDHERWHQPFSRVRLSVNVSPRSLDEGFPDFLVRTFRDAKLDPSRVTLEITETVAMDEGRALRVLERVRAIGFHVALDDFGSGYASFAQLQRIPANEVKIDRAFVSGMLDDAKDATIVRTAVDLVHLAGALAVVEGVDRDEILRAAADLGADLAQGYGIARPMSATALRAWLEREALAA
jgi:PAS domain S-box-containing protein/diguanylate cyclase (GGDEF)-like protein